MHRRCREWRTSSNHSARANYFGAMLAPDAFEMIAGNAEMMPQSRSSPLFDEPSLLEHTRAILRECAPHVGTWGANRPAGSRPAQPTAPFRMPRMQGRIAGIQACLRCRPSFTQVACYLCSVSPTEIRELRANLKCTARELAATLGIESSEVTAWEQGERFPTKKNVSDLAKLSLLGPDAISRKPRRQAGNGARGISRLADPALWEIVIKIAENPDLFDKVKQIADKYDLNGDREKRAD